MCCHENFVSHIRWDMSRMLRLAGILLLGCIGFSSSAPTLTETAVQDWVTLNSTVEKVFNPSSGYTSEFGYLKHVPSGKYIIPNDVLCPEDDDLLKIGTTSADRANKFRFVQNQGHLGYIEHDCGAEIHPKGGELNPPDGARVLVWDARHDGARFYFDEESDHIVHFGGKVFQTDRNLANPATGSDILLRSSSASEGSSFRFESNPYPSPEVAGRWEVLFAVFDPLGEHTYRIRYKVGKAITKQATPTNMWKFSAGIALSWFKDKEGLSHYVEKSGSETWNDEIEKEYVIKVETGKTVVTWQWIFGAERLDEAYRFRSTIVGNTDDINTPPVLDP